MKADQGIGRRNRSGEIDVVEGCNAPAGEQAAVASTPMTQPCRICGGPTLPSYVLHSRRHAIDVPTWCCTRCVAHFSDGGPVSYDDVDLTGYYSAWADAIRSRYERMFQFFETRQRPGRFMDVGTGMGYSLEVAQARGWKAAGIEPNATLARRAQECGLAVQHGYLADEGRPAFDLVLADNVLEHVPDPAGFLSNVARLMAPGALLVVAIPPIDWLRRALAWSSYVRDRVTRPQINVFSEVDEHVNMLGRRAMARLVDAVGLKLESTRFHHSSVFRNPITVALGIDDGYYFIRAR